MKKLMAIGIGLILFFQIIISCQLALLLNKEQDSYSPNDIALLNNRIDDLQSRLSFTEDRLMHEIPNSILSDMEVLLEEHANATTEAITESMEDEVSLADFQDLQMTVTKEVINGVDYLIFKAACSTGDDFSRLKQVVIKLYDQDGSFVRNSMDKRDTHFTCRFKYNEYNLYSYQVEGYYSNKKFVNPKLDVLLED